MGNSSISTFNLGTSLNGFSEQVNTTNVIISDISGSWNDPSGRVECQPTPPSACYFPYGYADNLITVPRNLDGSGIIIDPDNLLFNQDDNCNTFKIPKPNYLKYMGINTYLVYEGILADGKYVGGVGIQAAMDYEGPTNANIYTLSNYKDLLNQFVVMSFGTTILGNDTWPITGYIRKICITNKKTTVANAGWNQDRMSSSTTPFEWEASVDTPSQYAVGAAQYFEADVFKMFIEIQYINPDALLWQGTISRSNCIDQTIPIPTFNGSLPLTPPYLYPSFAGGAATPPAPNPPACVRPQFKPSFPNPGFIIKKQVDQVAFSDSVIALSSWAGDAVLADASCNIPLLGTIDVQSWYSHQTTPPWIFPALPEPSSFFSGSGYNASPMTVGIGQFKLSTRCSEPQVRQNKTRQSYLSCIEQGTKNIKFTKNTL